MYVVPKVPRRLVLVAISTTFRKLEAEPVSMFEMVAESVMAVPAVAAVGVMAPAVRSGVGWATVTVTDWSGEVPPEPVHWKVKVVLEVSGSVRPLPESVPELDQGPPAVQLVAFVELQVSVERAPYATDVGEAESEAVGAVVTGIQFDPDST